MKKARKSENQRKANASMQRPSQDMDHDIWKELPEELYEPLLARLPIATIFCFRKVCRNWNTLPSSPSFTKLLSATKKEQAHPWFFTTNDEAKGSLAIYDSSLKKWHHRMVPISCYSFPLASAGGLVCYIDYVHKTLCVCNPLTRSLRELPARRPDSNPCEYMPMSIGMTLLDGGSGYKVLWVDKSREYQVYDSTINSWSPPQPIPLNNPTYPLLLRHGSEAVCVDGTTLYFKMYYPEGFVSYDTSTGTWRLLMIPMPPHSRNQMPAECGGRIMLVGILNKKSGSCVCLWELQMKMMLWKEVDKMPRRWFPELHRVSCAGNKGLFMLSLSSIEGKKKLIVTYDPLSREWLRVPDCKSPSDRRKKARVLSGTAFYPSFTATA